ncbi:MAG: lysozyme inhibitor LprI family protein [Hyphomicrobiaceae bacterium]
MPRNEGERVRRKAISAFKFWRDFMGKWERLSVCLLALGVGCTFHVAASAQVAYWDCDPYIARRKCPELVICTILELGALDNRLNTAYRQIMDRLPDASQKTLWQAAQATWRSRRDICGCNAECIRREYLSRVRSLEDQVSGQPPPPQPPSHPPSSPSEACKEFPNLC